MSKPVLYSFFASSASWRVRIALALKGMEYEYRAVQLVKGEQQSDDYKKVNPQSVVPSLVIDDHVLTQSLSIIEYLDETRPDPPILPKDDPYKRAEARRLALIIAADIQPLQNLKVLRKIGEGKREWGQKIIDDGFQALEKAFENTAGKYCVGDQVTLPDLCLVPQVFNAVERFKVDMTKFPIIARINSNLSELQAFQMSHPLSQPDFTEEAINNLRSVK